ncbi:MAG: MFS transporter, partial [Microvirga sp.]
VQSPRALTGFGFSASVLQTSIIYLLPGAVVSIVIGPLAGRLVGRIGPRLVLAIACGLAAVASASLAFLHTGKAEVIIAFIVVSCGIAMAYSSMPALLISHVQPAETGIANSINSIMRTVGGTIGSALIITILAAQTQQAGPLRLPSESAFRTSYILGAVLYALGAALVLIFIDRRPPAAAPATPATPAPSQVAAPAAQ